jgi:putative peptidoglycan lipid II flippase
MSALLALAAARIDWFGLAGRESVRIAWMAAALVGAALVYFGVLLAAGLRPREFSRRA